MKIKKFLFMLEIACLAFLLCSFIPFNVFAVSSVGLGDVTYTEKMNIDNGVSVEYAVGYNNLEEEKAYTAEITKGALTPYATYGQYVYGGEILSSMIKTAENEFNKKVVLAINGDFYDTSNGIPLGIMIVNGKLATLGTTSSSEAALGFKADGTVVFGNPKLSVSFNDGTGDKGVKYLNNDRKNNTSDLYLYSSAYGTSTKSLYAGTEVVLETSEETFVIGETIKAKVISRGTKNEAITQGKLVIASGVENDSRLAGLTVGKEITITVNDGDPSQGWKDVVQSIGYPHLLAVNGKGTSAMDDPAVHPRTALGVKEDGTIVLFQVDGRQPGWSNGLTFKQMVEWLCDVKGCKTVVNLDGGGSSTIMARLPGNENCEVLNSPSDGGERSNSNAILFFSNTEKDPTNTISHLHTYPKNLFILEGAKTKIEVKATDKNYYPVSVPTNLTYSIDENLGTIDNNGNYTAAIGAATGKITVSSGDIQTDLDVKIVDSITKMTCDKTIISVAPKDRLELTMTAYSGSAPIVASNSSFKWTLSSSSIGTVNEGVFTGSSTGGTGTLTVSFKTYKVVIPVEVGKLPTMISTFENVTIGSNWLQTIESPAGGGKGNVSINTDERYVKFGKSSLRVDYDFRNATGTTSVTAYQAGGYYKLEGYPTQVGMWVYGDGNGANVRIQIRDGKNAVQYISFKPDTVSWTGWKYIEADITPGLPTPIQIQYPIRVMSVGGKVKTNGTLYFDNLRAVYGFKNDDVLEPSCEGITPAQGSVVANRQEHISVTIIDKPDVTKNYTGINKESIEMWINEEPIENLVLVDNVDGSISVNYTPSALSLLKPGPQIVKVRVEDNYGNITFKQWDFLVSGEYVSVSGEKPSNSIFYAGDTLDYYVTTNTYKDFEKLTGAVNFNKDALQIKSVTNLDKNITLTKDSVSQANKAGKLSFTASGMKNFEMPANGRLFKISFTTKDAFTAGADSKIIFDNALVYETGYEKPTKYQLPSYEVSVDYRYRISCMTTTVGNAITFTVTDENLVPIEGASFEVTNPTIAVSEKTDANGKATLNEFANLAVNSTFQIRVKKDAYYSAKLTVTMRESLGTAKPANIFLSPGVDASSSVYITYQTNLYTTDTKAMYRVKGQTEWQDVKDTGKVERIYVSNSGNIQEYLSHIVCIDELIPNTEYEYYVGSEGNYSDIKAFKTTPNDSLNIVFFGDPQNVSAAGYEITKKAVMGALAKNPAATLAMYAGDIVDDVTQYSEWQAFHQVLGGYNSSIITAAATGNHDVITSYSDPFIYSLTPNQNGIDTIGSNYYFEAGNAIIAVIDTETPNLFNAQSEWLKNVMASSSKTFRIVLMHRSPYAANYDEPYIRDYWPKVFEDANVDLVLSGHDHVYSSTTMKDGKKVTPDVGVTYVVGGSCGQKYYSANNPSIRYWLDYVYDDDNTVFSTIEINADKLILKSYAIVGTEHQLMNEITLSSKKIDVKEIKVSGNNQLLTTLNEVSLSALVYDSQDKVIASDVSWSLKENVKGVVLLDNGVLKLTNEFEKAQDITIIATYYGKQQEVTIKAQKLDILSVLKTIKDAQDDMISGLFN